MNAVPFDTLKLARGLEAAGLAAPVAAGTAEALAEAMGGADLATKSDIAGLRTELVGRMDAWGADTSAKFAAMSMDMNAKFAAMGMDMNAKFMAMNADFTAKMELLRRDMTIRLGSLVLVGVGVILAAMRFMPHP